MSDLSEAAIKMLKLHRKKLELQKELADLRPELTKAEGEFQVKVIQILGHLPDRIILQLELETILIELDQENGQVTSVETPRTFVVKGIDIAFSV